MITPSCSPHVASDHKIGDDAKQVTVTVSVTCLGIAFDAHQIYADATQVIPKDFRTGSSLIGDIHVSVLNATITDHSRGIATLSVKIHATTVYQITPGEKEEMIHLIAGKTPQQARAILLQVPGIAGAAITITGNTATLPTDPGRITIVVVKLSAFVRHSFGLSSQQRS